MQAIRYAPLLGLLALCPPAAAQEPTTETLQARDGTEQTLEYGFVSVPENRADGESRQIQVAYVRVASKAEEKGPPVFFLSGGPGGSSIEAVENFVGGGGDRFFDLIGADIVGIDQRGVGRSIPNLETEVTYGFDPAAAGDVAERIERMVEVSRAEAERLRQEGVDLAGYTTVESADDMDAVRRALGYEQIQLWGASYGTHLGLAAIRRHGGTIARALLVGPEGPDHTVKTPGQFDAGLAAVGALVAKDEALGELAGDLPGLAREVLAQLEKEPAAVQVGGREVRVSKSDVQGWLAGAIGNSPDEIGGVPARLLEMKAGDFAQMAAMFVEERASSGPFSAMAMVMDSASGMSEARAKRIAEEAKTSLFGGVATADFVPLAKAWGAPDLGPEFRSGLESDVPILFVCGDLDSRTPVANAQELMKTLPNAQLLVVENAPHGIPMGMPELRSAWSAFLRGEAVTVERLVGPPIPFSLPAGMKPKAPGGAVPIEASLLGEYAGEYAFDNGMVFAIEAAEGHLKATLSGRGPFDLWPESDAVFFCENENIPTLTFIRNDAGAVIAVDGGGIRGARR